MTMAGDPNKYYNLLLVPSSVIMIFGIAVSMWYGVGGGYDDCAIGSVIDSNRNS